MQLNEFDVLRDGAVAQTHTERDWHYLTHKEPESISRVTRESLLAVRQNNESAADKQTDDKVL